MFGIRRGGPEPPPPGVGATPAPGYTVRELPSIDAVSAFCKAWGVGLANDYNNHATAGCVIPGLKAEVLPSPDAVGKDQFPAYQRHENAHTYNLVHGPDGREGWYRNGPIPDGIDPKVAAALALLPMTPAYAAQAAGRSPDTAMATVSPKPPPSALVQALRGAK
jgi:hypothetical protein